MKIGYARVSRTDQNPELQTDALNKAGAEKIFVDKVSGAKAERPGLSQLLGTIRSGDTLIIWKLDRLARSLEHLDDLRKQLESRGIDFVSLTEGFDTTKPAGKLSFHIVGAIAEFERDLIRERTRAGLDAARSRGKLGGRRPALSSEKRSAVAKLLQESRDFAAIGRTVGVSERTIRRFADGKYPK